MIQRQLVGGEPATVVYMKGDFEPATLDDYESVKIVFDSGKTVWARPQKPRQPNPGGAIDAYDPSEARNPKGKGGGQWTKGGGGGAIQPSSGTAAPSAPQTSPIVRPARHMLVGDFAQVMPPADSTQDVKSLDELYQRASADEPVFKQKLESVAAAVGGVAIFTPAEYAEPGTTLKSRKSAERKVRDEYGGDVTQLKDVLRGTIMCHTVEDTRAAAYLFMQQNQKNIVRVKDRVVNPLDEGYRDIMINFRTPSGLVSEIQFNTTHMLAVKDGVGHRMYEILRRLKASPHKEAHKRTWDGIHEKSRLEFGNAHQMGGNGKWRAGGDDSQITGDQMSNDEYTYRLTTPSGETFFAMVAFEPGITVYTTRGTGAWHQDETLDPADLMMPEQGPLYDWDIERITGNAGNAAG